MEKYLLDRSPEDLDSPWSVTVCSERVLHLHGDYEEQGGGSKPLPNGCEGRYIET